MVVLNPARLPFINTSKHITSVASNSSAQKRIFYNPATQFPFNFLKITTSTL